MHPPESAVDLRTLRQTLLHWFDEHARDLPWRTDRDAYRIWISEVMLQQTTVAAVVPYFERFLARYANIEALAEANEHDILLLWQGLGYYSRARNLLKAAQMIVREHDSRFPDNPELAAKLPGIGRYTAGAILSQAYEKRLPIVEANTRRLYARLYARFELKDKAGRDWLWQTAETLLPRKRIGDFNQALMELGALVCKPIPLCGECPLAKQCQAHRLGLQHRLPIVAAVKKFTEVRSLALAIVSEGRYLLVRRGSQGRWSNLWEFPHKELREGETEPQAARRLLKELKLKAAFEREIAVINYGITRFKIRMVCWEMHLKGKQRESESLRWLKPTEWPDYPLSTPMRKLASAINDQPSAFS